MELRPQDPPPEWTTHVAVVEGQQFKLMARKDYSPHSFRNNTTTGFIQSAQVQPNIHKEPMMDLKNVRVKYGEREVSTHESDENCSNVRRFCAISPGRLFQAIGGGLKVSHNRLLPSGMTKPCKGPNGSGKTTLLSILTGEHPQSYTQAHFRIFGSRRSQIPTVAIQRKVAVFTPEIFAAFPRRLGHGAMTVLDAIGTGFENTYSYRPLNAEQAAIRDELIQQLAPGNTDHERRQWSRSFFAALPPPEQALALFMRTLVSKAPLLILDEIFGGMDDQMIKRCSSYLRDSIKQDQAVIFVSHWEHEVPWADARKYELVDGVGRVSQ